MKKVLVTGSSGTIGTRLCEHMMGLGLEVVGVDRRPNSWSPQVQEITHICDLRDETAVAQLPGDVDAVVHLAANARVHELVLDPSMARDNFLTVFNVAEFARRNEVGKLVFASSREVYGNTGTALHAEEPVRVADAESPYSATKLAGEALVHSYGKCYGVPYVIIRFSNVYGMYDDSDRVVPLFIRRALANERLTVFGADKLLDFTYIDDAIHGIMQILNRFDRARDDTYNLAFGEGTSILQVAQSVQSMLGREEQIDVKDTRVGEVVQYIADLTNAREKLLYNPQVPFSEGIAKSLDWYRAHLYKD